MTKSKHLYKKNLSYTKHFKRAMTFSFYFWLASLRFFMHGFFPDFAPNTVNWLKGKLPK